MKLFSCSSAINTSSEVVTSLKAELERCLISNRQKRAQVMELKDDLKTLKKDLSEYKLRCDKADILTQEQKVIHPGPWKYYARLGQPGPISFRTS